MLSLQHLGCMGWSRLKKINKALELIRDEDGDIEMDIGGLAKELSNLKLMMSKIVGHQEQERVGCYICGKFGHIARNCVVPCQTCGKRGHATDRCRSRPEGSNKDQRRVDIHYVTKLVNGLRDEINEIYQVKRLRDEEIGDKKKTRIESLLNPVVPPSKKNESRTAPTKAVWRERNNRQIGTLRNEPITDKELDIKKLLENAVVPTSLAVLLKEVGHLRTDLKQLLITPRKEQKSEKDIMDTRLMESEEIIQETLLVTDMGAPKTRVYINDLASTALLDGGSATNIVSLNLVNKLGIQDITECRTIFALADGSRKHAIGQLNNLELEIQGIQKPIQAVIFDQDDFEILLGRPGLISFGIVTDWSKQGWKMSRNRKEVPLPILYDKNTDEEKIYVINGSCSQGNDTDDLTPSQLEIKEDFLKRNKDLLIEKLEELHPADVPPLCLEVDETKPVKLRPYILPFSHDKFVEQEIPTMLARGIIEPSTASWRSPVVIVNKNGGKLRLCVDYREVNKRMKDKVFLSPRIEEIVERQLGNKWFTNLDLFSGYHQIPLDEECRKFTTFVIRQKSVWELYQYMVLPFGLKIAPAEFQRIMNDVFKSELGRTLSIYLDDMNIGTKGEDLESHVNVVERIFKIARDKKMKFDSQKCQFFKRFMYIYGFYVDGRGVHTDPTMVKKILNVESPRNVKELRGLIGLLGYYRKFVPHFSTLAEPLIHLTRKNIPFTWNEELEGVVNKLKLLTTQPPILMHPDPSKGFLLYTDASNWGVGAVLAQVHKDGEHPCLFSSRAFTNAEKNYCTWEKEALALVSSVKKFRKYLLRTKFKAYTDCTAVKYLFNKKDVTARMQRWIMQLAEFEFTLNHIKGKKNIIADYLSRNADKEEIMIDDIYMVQAESHSDYEGELRTIPKLLETLELPIGSDVNNKYIRKKACIFITMKGYLYKKDDNLRKVPYISERKKILEELHDGMGHGGQDIIQGLLRKRFWRPKMSEQANEYLKNCPDCQFFHGSNKDQYYIPIQPSDLFETWGVDFIGPLPPGTNQEKYIIVAVEHATRWLVAKAVHSADAKTTAKFIYEEIFCCFGPPRRIITDRGTHFTSQVVEKL